MMKAHLLQARGWRRCGCGQVRSGAECVECVRLDSPGVVGAATAADVAAVVASIDARNAADAPAREAGIEAARVRDAAAVIRRAVDAEADALRAGTLAADVVRCRSAVARWQAGNPQSSVRGKYGRYGLSQGLWAALLSAGGGAVAGAAEYAMQTGAMARPAPATDVGGGEYSKVD